MKGFTVEGEPVEFGSDALIFTHDMLVEGVHFLPGQDPADVAWKLVATNMSDLAAKGAEDGKPIQIGHMNIKEYGVDLGMLLNPFERAAAFRSRRARRARPTFHF